MKKIYKNKKCRKYVVHFPVFYPSQSPAVDGQANAERKEEPKEKDEASQFCCSPMHWGGRNPKEIGSKCSLIFFVLPPQSIAEMDGRPFVNAKLDPQKQK